MNTSDVPPSNGILQQVDHQDERGASCSVPNSDSNANVNDGIDRSKGAIPKIRTVSKPTGSSQRKTIKFNNNVEEVHSVNGIINDCTRELKRNGFDKEFKETQNSVAVFASGYDDLEIFENNVIDDQINCSNRELSHPFDYQSSIASPDFRTLCLKKNETKDDSENSSDDTELLSISDDGCIYTYKGDNAADLPESFFSLDIPLLENQNVVEAQQRNSSPEMDFLEMDFDPGPAGDADSDSNSDHEHVRTPSIAQSNNKAEGECSISHVKCLWDRHEKSESEVQNNLLPAVCESINENVENLTTEKTKPPRTVEDVKMPWSCVLSERTTGLTCSRTLRKQHNACGELVSPVEPISPTGSEPIGLSVFQPNPERPIVAVNRTMIWSEEEAANLQVLQIGASACGATAVLNVLKALRFPLPTKEALQEAVQTRLRANFSPFVEYLLSRSSAGTTHEDLIDGLDKLSDGRIYARFFAMYPERVVNLNMWLSFWIENGAVPIATLNLQKGIQPVPDAWHHQMIYGVSEEGIHLTNPLECVRAEDLWPQLCSDSVLLIKREDVLSRWNREEFVKLMRLKDGRWRKLNVVGEFFGREGFLNSIFKNY